MAAHEMNVESFFKKILFIYYLYKYTVGFIDHITEVIEFNLLKITAR